MGDKKSQFSVSVIIPMLNAETTVLLTLDSVFNQVYPIEEIIIVDNGSSDSSVEIVRKFIAKNKKIPVQLLINKSNRGVGGSYNRGVKKAKSEYIVLMHSDSTLRTKNELSKLVKPYFSNTNVVATYSSIVLPHKIWNTYNFWQRVLSSKAVDRKMAGLNTKFDCINKKAFISIGGFDAKNYGHHIGVGSEDAAMHFALRTKGEVIKSDAVVVHLHYLGSNFSLQQLFQTKKLLARSYGRLIRIEMGKLGFGLFLLLAKPVVFLFFLLGFLSFYFFIPVILYVLLNDWTMYSQKKSYSDIRILILPLITFFLIFLESYWTVESFLFLKRRPV